MIAALSSVAICLCVTPQPAAADPFDPWTQPARYQLEYQVDLASIDAKPDDDIEVWLPLPADGPAQRLLSVQVESSWSHRRTGDDLGNRFIHTKRDPSQPTTGELILRCVINRLPVSRSVPERARIDSAHDLDRNRASERRAPADGRIRAIADQLCRNLDSPATKIRALYDYVLDNMRYSKKGRGWGRGDARWACDSKYGNCTDFHSLLIAMAHTQRIPARFVIGFPIPSDRTRGEITGYHCWAELFDDSRGWIPVDASEAWKSQRPDAYYGKLPADRVAFTTGRDLVLEPPQHGDRLNFFVFPYVEVNDHPVAPPKWYLRFVRTPGGGLDD